MKNKSTESDTKQNLKILKLKLFYLLLSLNISFRCEYIIMTAYIILRLKNIFLLYFLYRQNLKEFKILKAPRSCSFSLIRNTGSHLASIGTKAALIDFPTHDFISSFSGQVR